MLIWLTCRFVIIVCFCWNVDSFDLFNITWFLDFGSLYVGVMELPIFDGSRLEYFLQSFCLVEWKVPGSYANFADFWRSWFLSLVTKNTWGQDPRHLLALSLVSLGNHRRQCLLCRSPPPPHGTPLWAAGPRYPHRSPSAQCSSCVSRTWQRVGLLTPPSTTECPWASSRLDKLLFFSL